MLNCRRQNIVLITKILSDDEFVVMIITSIRANEEIRFRPTDQDVSSADTSQKVPTRTIVDYMLS